MPRRIARVRVSLRLALFVVAAFAFYFAVNRGISRDHLVTEAVTQRDARQMRTIARWFPYAITSNRYSDSILMDAIKQREDDAELVEAILMADPELSKGKRGDNTPLVYSIVTGQYEIAKTLIGAGADVEQPDRFGRLPLFFVAETGYGSDATVELTRLMLEHGADPTISNARGISFVNVIVQSCVSARCLEVLQNLVDSGVDVARAKDENGDTALHAFSRWNQRYADRKLNHRTLKFLLDHGANIESVNDRGETPIMVAARASVEVNAKSVAALQILRHLPVTQWECSVINQLASFGATTDLNESAIETIFDGVEHKSRDPEYERVLIARRVNIDGVLCDYWFVAYPGKSVWIHHGRAFGGVQAVGEPFAFADVDVKRKHAASRQRGDLPVISERLWGDATITANPNSRTVRCAIGDHWIDFDLSGNGKPPQRSQSADGS